MTKTLEIYCDICEDWIDDIQDVNNIEQEEVHKLINQSLFIGLWSEGYTSDYDNYTFICMKCIKYAYHLKHGKPLGYRIREWNYQIRMKLTMWINKQKARLRK
jgi:hypothetical protein